MASRKEKYPETKWFHFHNENPKNRITDDCVIRAIATGLEQGYNTTVIEMVEMMCKTGYMLNSAKGIELYMNKKGLRKLPQLKKADGKKYTGKEFCDYLTKNFPDGSLGNIIANIGGHHTVCIKWYDDSYKVHDIWDSTDGCVGNYYLY